MIYGSIVCLIIASLIGLGNIIGCIAASIRSKRGSDKGYSNVPFFSLLFSFGAWLLGRQTIGYWSFLPTVLDPGTWMLLALPVVIIENLRHKKSD